MVGNELLTQREKTIAVLAAHLLLTKKELEGSSLIYLERDISDESIKSLGMDAEKILFELIELFGIAVSVRLIISCEKSNERKFALRLYQ